MMHARTCRSEQTVGSARRARALAWSVGLAVLAGGVAPASAQTGAAARVDGDWLSKRPGGWSKLTAPATAQRRTAARSTVAAATPCEDDPAFLCTTVPVPLDRRHPDGRMVNLHVEVLPHTGPQEQADGAVFVTCGGPGCSITSGPKYGFAFFVLPEVAQTRDLVFVDQRGVALSDAIDCPGLQTGAPFSLYEDTAACHDQLGDASDLYSTTDVADDLEDVRAALGYGRIDLFGGSYAGADMMTYAVRHTKRVRSVVLSSPAVVVGTDPFYAYAPEAMTGIAAKVCGRSPACRAANPDPAGAFVRAARDLRRHPVGGVGVDSEGASHEITVTENLLAAGIMYFGGAHFTGPGEIIPAMAAARRGDTVPLLRLGADNDPANGFGEDLRVFSAGHSMVRSCVDGVFPFDKTARPLTRAAQFARAYAREPAFYGPISKPAWVHPGYLGFQPSPCIVRRWEDRQMYREGARVKGVPTLVLGGEYDLPVPEAVARLATRVMRGASYVGISAAGHDPQFWGDCGSELVQRFYATKAVGDTSCAARRAGGWWVPGSFPKRVADAPPAAQTDGPPAPARLRRLATVAAWTMMDSVQHNFFVPGDGVALRGGTVDFEEVEGGVQWTLGEAHFTDDVIVTGPVTAMGPDFDAELVVSGPGGTSTTMHISGQFLVEGEDMSVVFDVGGEPATFAVPGY